MYLNWKTCWICHFS